MTAYERYAQNILRAAGDTAAKATMTTAVMAAVPAIELDWERTTEMYGNDETPILSMIGHNTSKAITHRWREGTRRDAASNTSDEGSAAKAAVSVTPSVRSNTCQIIKGTIGVTESAITEAANGIYGDDVVDDVAWQLEQEMAGLLKDTEHALLFGVESTTDPRQMQGLVGAVGTWDGVIQTTRKDLSEAAFSETNFNAFLTDIWNQQAGRYPTDLFCSMAATKTINGFTTNYRKTVVTAQDLANLPAGTRVVKYVAPWGGVIDIIPHPLCENSATKANNWMMALRTDLVKLSDFRPRKIRRVTLDADGQEWEIIWEGTLQAKVESAHGIMRNFAQIT